MAASVHFAATSVTMGGVGSPVITRHATSTSLAHVRRMQCGDLCGLAFRRRDSQDK
jgi:hypothetical protein